MLKTVAKVTLLLIGVLILGLLLKPDKNPKNTTNLPEITLYRSPNCGCCVEYVKYLQRRGFKVNVNVVDNITVIKEGFSVPKVLESCHTSKIGNFIVEGHVPVEAILKLLEEKPAISGIALPGMPPASPGMPGVKKEPFVIYSFVGKEINEFMRL